MCNKSDTFVEQVFGITISSLPYLLSLGLKQRIYRLFTMLKEEQCPRKHGLLRSIGLYLLILSYRNSSY